MEKKAIQKAATCRALLNALQEELLSSQRLTVESIAARAAVNKALVYRHFGGLHGLVAAYASSDRFMPSAEEISAICGDNLHELSARERFMWCIQAYVKALAQRPGTVQILLRLPTFSRETLSALAEGRSRALEQIRKVFGEEEPGFDRELAFSLLISGVSVLLGTRRDRWSNEPTDPSELCARIVETLGSLLGGKIRR